MLSAMTERAGSAPLARRLGSRATGIAVITSALAVGSLLRLAWLDRQGFWTDELYAIGEARQPLDVLFDPRLHLQHPPGYRLALHYWLALGQGEIQIRILSALMGV